MNWLTGWLVGWLVGWLAGWLVGWLVGFLAGCLVGRLVGRQAIFETLKPAASTVLFVTTTPYDMPLVRSYRVAIRLAAG